MKKLVLLLLIGTQCALGQSEFAQAPLTPSQVGRVFRDVPIEGSQYVNEIYKKGETLMGEKTQTSALMRYDAYNEVVEILDKGEPRELLRRKSIKAIIDDVVYEVVEYKEAGRIKLGYLNPLNDGETILYYRPKKQFVQAKNPENGYEDYQPPTFLDVSMFYIKKGDKPAEKVSLNKGRILRTLADQKSVLKKFIEEHDLNLNKVEDAAKVLAYYNSIKKTSGSIELFERTAVGR